MCQSHYRVHWNKDELNIKNWKDITSLLCENLITLIRYRDACKTKDLSIVKNKSIHEYIMTRIENIENCYSTLYLSNKIDYDQFETFEGVQDAMVNTLEGVIGSSLYDDILDSYGIWSSFKLFDWYINTFLNSNFFKENDIRIE